MGQEVKWSWAVCVSLYVCAYMCKSYLWVASSSCVHSQHRCMRLFTLRTIFLCSDDVLFSSSVAQCVSPFWQLLCNEDEFLMCLWPSTLIVTTSEPSHLCLCSSPFLLIMGGLCSSITRKTLHCLERTAHQETTFTNPHSSPNFLVEHLC